MSLVPVWTQPANPSPSSSSSRLPTLSHTSFHFAILNHLDDYCSSVHQSINHAAPYEAPLILLSWSKAHSFREKCITVVTRSVRRGSRGDTTRYFSTTFQSTHQSTPTTIVQPFLCSQLSHEVFEQPDTESCWQFRTTRSFRLWDPATILTASDFDFLLICPSIRLGLLRPRLWEDRLRGQVKRSTP